MLVGIQSLMSSKIKRREKRIERKKIKTLRKQRMRSVENHNGKDNRQAEENRLKFETLSWKSVDKLRVYKNMI